MQVPDTTSGYLMTVQPRMAALSATGGVWFIMPASFPHDTFFHGQPQVPLHTLISTTSPTPCLFLIRPPL